MPQATIEQALSLAEQLQLSGRLPESRSVCEQILAQFPDHVLATHLLAAVLTQLGQFDAAIDLLRKVVARQPANAAAHTSLGVALMGLNRTDEARACFERAIAADPNYARAHCNLGVVHSGRREFEHAVACYRRAVALEPGYVQALCNLGASLNEAGRAEEGIESLRQAVALRPDYAEAQYNLGTALAAVKRFAEAIEWFGRAAGGLDRDNPKTLGNLASALWHVGRYDESVATYRRALAADPSDTQAHSSLILTMHYHPDCTVADIAKELARWNDRHARPLAAEIRPHENERSPDRRLRIGYVSPDLHYHSVGRFMLPILEHHNREEFEVYCYSSVVRPDDVTARLKSHASVWRDVAALSDSALAEQIRRDGIDLLVDLSLHTARNRLLTFVRKPAPVQITYLAYCGSSGMPAMDYRLSDPHFDPPGGDESIYPERTLRLKTYWCYQPGGNEPEPGILLASITGQITFGCLNNFAKVTAPTLEAWARILQRVENSKIIIHTPVDDNGQRAREIFARAGVDPARLTTMPTLLTPDYFAMHQRIEIALDPFPFGGGTTSCDALWMGVPLVSLAGEGPMGRAGLSILSTIGLPELVARSADEYVRIAAELAGNIPRLTDLRHTLRQRMRQSPLMDPAQFTRDLEGLYRTAWKNYLAESI